MSEERWQVVYAGFRFEPRTGARRHLYFRVDEPGQHHAASGRILEMKKELLPATPGAVIEIDVRIDDDGLISVFAQGRSYATLDWRDREPEAVVMWTAEDRANTSLAHAARAAKRDDFDKSALSGIRDAYLQMAAPQRAQLLALVVRYITAGR